MNSQLSRIGQIHRIIKINKGGEDMRKVPTRKYNLIINDEEYQKKSPEEKERQNIAVGEWKYSYNLRRYREEQEKKNHII